MRRRHERQGAGDVAGRRYLGMGCLSSVENPMTNRTDAELAKAGWQINWYDVEDGHHWAVRRPDGTVASRGWLTRKDALREAERLIKEAFALANGLEEK